MDPSATLDWGAAPSPAVDASAGEEVELARGVQSNVANSIVSRAR
jgi:hypothetical protein